MATSAASAQQWLDEQQPDRAAVEDVIAKLEQRIEQHGDDEDAVAGSLEALTVLQEHLASLEVPAESSETPAANLDNSALIPESEPVELEADVKRRTFEALKQRLKDL